MTTGGIHNNDISHPLEFIKPLFNHPNCIFLSFIAIKRHFDLFSDLFQLFIGSRPVNITSD